MAIIETSVSISKPVEKVFDFITNLDNQKKMSEYITGIEVAGPLKVGTRYKIKTTTMGRTFETENEVVALEPNKKFAVKTIAAPPASDVTNTYVLVKDGTGTKVTATMDAVVMTMGMPGMEDMVKNQLKGALDGTLALIKKTLEA
jgi:uncharacterized membrane protein